MAAIKVAVVAVPAMLREVLNQLLGDAPDIELVEPRQPAPSEEPPDGADVVLLATREEGDSECWRLLLANPDSSVLAVDRGARNASLFQLRRHKESLGEPSAEGLLAAIRRAAG